jgi:hypothetical protein
MSAHFKRRIKEQEARITFADRLHDRLCQVQREVAENENLSVREVCRRLGLDFYEDKDGQPRIAKPDRFLGSARKKGGKS